MVSGIKCLCKIDELYEGWYIMVISHIQECLESKEAIGTSNSRYIVRLKFTLVSIEYRKASFIHGAAKYL